MFFDCHLHITFKHFLSDRSKPIWEQLPGLSILKSQSCLSQLKAGGVKLVVVAIYPIERPFSAATMIQLFGPGLTPIDKNRLNDVINSPYNDLIWDELELLETDPRKSEYNILRTMADYDESKINLLFSIEGGHGLYGSGSLTENLKALRNHQTYRFVFLNLAHLTQQESICAHAFGMKMLKKNDEFKPNGYGIGPEGLKIVEAAYDTSVNPIPLLIDVKHMSLLARQQFYKLPAVQGHSILASHVGVTGMSYKDIHTIIKGAAVVDREFVEVKYKRVSGINKTHFNPWSINLYDEEIRTIVASRGLIGLNLDQRIQGADNPKGEYWSLKEFRHVVDTKKLKVVLSNFEIPDEPMEDQEEQRGLVLNVKKHLRQFANTILHIVRVGGPSAWDCICIGSDFDGLINPLNCCRSAEEYGFFRQGLINTLPEMIADIAQEAPELGLNAGDISARVDQICFGNGFSFWKRHLTARR